jgi:endoglucanase
MFKLSCLLILVVLIVAVRPAAAVDPHVKWVYAAQGQLYASPLVADVNPAPGLETIVSDAEVRKLRCIDARGKELWELGGVWKKRLIQAPVLSRTARPGMATLLIGNGDGSLTAIDARTGKLIWQRQVGSVEWGGVMWADLYGKHRDCAIAVTQDDGIVALDGDGRTLWRYRGRPESASHSIENAAAVADLDGDGKQEILAVTDMGPICLNSDGKLRWEHYTGDDFKSSATVADPEHDGTPKVYCCSSDDNALWCFDARTGAVRWRLPLLGGTETYPGASIPVADVDGCGHEEILCADADGRVYCVGADGRLRWIFQTSKQTHVSLCAGDVDGDGQVETLAASGDHYLYCLDGRGALKWRYAADLRLVFPPTIADIDQDGRADILVASSDHKLRCLTLGGRYVPALTPWPSRRYDVAGSGAPFGRAAKTPDPIVETRELLRWGSFDVAKSTRDPKEYPPGSTTLAERSAFPRGWTASVVPAEGQNGAPNDNSRVWLPDCRMDGAVRFEGKPSIRVSGDAVPFEIASDPVDADLSLQTVTATVHMRGEGGGASVRWIGPNGIVREDALAPDTRGGEPSGPGSWRMLALRSAPRPAAARWVSLVLRGPAVSMIWWSDAHVEGSSVRPPALRVMVNQVGYDAGAPKRFTAQANFTAKDAQFEILGADGAVVYHGALEPRGRIVGAYNSDWGFNYWRGDFTGFNRPGRYRIRIRLDAQTDVSWPFGIDRNLLWKKTARPAYRFFYYQRCGFEVPGFHKACHLDDAASPDHKIQLHLVGGWHDAGDYNKYHNAPYVLGLARAYEAAKGRFDAQRLSKTGRPDLLDEIVWGAQHCARMILPDGSVPGAITSGYGYWGPPELETDNKPGTGDERTVDPPSGVDPSVHVAALAKAARYATAARPELMPALLRGMAWAHAKNLRNPEILSAALDLYAITGAPKWAALAKSLFPSCGFANLDTVREYDAAFKEDHSAEVRQRLVQAADDLLRSADNPFGVPTGGSPGAPNFFGTPASQGGWHVGTSSTLMNAAAVAAQAYAVNPDPRYLTFVYDQFNWELGNNPYDLSLMEGQGSRNPPTYHQRLMFAGVARGAVPGSVVNGITWRAAGDDRPYFDMRGLDIPDYESNEVWLPHNTAYVNAISRLPGR